MKTFAFEGESDDIFGETNRTGQEHCNFASGEPIVYKLSAPDGSGILITGLWGTQIGSEGDGWVICVNTLDEEKKIDWPIRMYPSNGGYKNKLVVEAPEDVTLVCLNCEASE